MRRHRFAGAFKSRRRQNRRPFMRVRPLLHFHLRKNNRRSHRRYRHASAFRSANPVEHMLLVPGGHNPCQRRQRRAHNIHSPHQFVRSPVHINLVNNHRQHLKRLRQRARRQREPALNVVEIQPVRFPLFLGFVDQLLPHIFFRHGLAGGHDQIPLPPRGHHPGWFRPCPFETLKFLIGIRDIRKLFSTPS